MNRRLIAFVILWIIFWLAAFYALFYLARYHHLDWWFMPTEILIGLFLVVSGLLLIGYLDKVTRTEEEAKAKKEVNEPGHIPRHEL